MAQVNALVMSGGGARGSFELGVIDYLIRDQGLDFNVITGVSTGALNAAILAQGEGHSGLVEAVELIKEIYFSIEGHRDIYLKRGTARYFDLDTDLDDLLGSISSTSVYDLSPLERLLRTHLDVEKLRISGRHLRVGAVSLQSGQYESVDASSDAIRDYVYASAAIPVFFEPVSINGTQYVDGGVRNITPLQDAFDVLKTISHPDNEHAIYVVLATPLNVDERVNFEADDVLDVVKRTADIMTAEIYKNDLKQAELVNKMVQLIHTEEWDREELSERDLEEFADMLHANMLVFAPEESLIDPLDFSPDRIRASFEAGREIAAGVMEAE